MTNNQKNVMSVIVICQAIHLIQGLYKYFKFT